MNGFTLLWSKILDSTIWMESKETRLVWITMLAMKDVDGVVRSAPKALAHRARVTEEECREALRVLMAPEEESSSKAEGGRRIVEVDGGWLVVNHDKYRFSTEAKREFWRRSKAEERARKAGSGSPTRARRKNQRELNHLATEKRFEKAVGDGDEAKADQIVDGGE